MTLEQGDGTNGSKWKKENIAPPGRPPHFIDTLVISPEVQSQMPVKGESFVQVVTRKIKSVLKRNNSPL